MSGPEDLDRPDRVSHVIEQHVGRVEIHLDVRRLQLVERRRKQVRGLLPGLERQGHAAFPGKVAGPGERVEHGGSLRVVAAREGSPHAASGR